MRKCGVILSGLMLIASTLFGGLSVSDVQSNADISSVVDGEIVLVYTNTDSNGTFTLPKNSKARVLVVAGGGAGGSMAYEDLLGNGAGGGGGAGGVSDHETILEPGTYGVVVGKGGAKVQTIVQSWVGANGGNSSLTFNGSSLFLAKGGGGGGSAKINGNGEDGGSGGGGSWYTDGFTKGGSYVDGQGWMGGTSTNATYGAGGGGSAIDSKNGCGKANGEGGQGRTLDITGSNVVYGQGGNGGCHSLTNLVDDAAGFGFGGNGANASGRGGKGGDGIVVVRIHSLFDYESVEPPTPTSFEWKDGANYVEFNLEDSGLKGAIDYIEGTTNMVCSLGTDDSGNVVTNGIGRFNYAIHLKDTYKWSDGSTNAKVVYWRVKEPNTIGEATIEVDKTVSFSDGENAIISINIHTTPEQSGATPNVLFLGSICNAHGFSINVFNAAMNAITSVGNVDYYLFTPGAYDSDVASDTNFTTPKLSGSLGQGESLTTAEISTISSTLAGGKHGVIYQFYEQLSKVIDGDKTYDYIVFSFDGGLAATMFPGTHPSESKVSEFLKDYYADGKVIWLVADEETSDDTDKLPSGLIQNPWRVCPIAYAHNTSASDGYWHMLDYYVGTWGHNNQKSSPYGYSAYMAMLGLFAPNTYAKGMTSTEYAPDMTTDKLVDSTSNIAKAKRLQADEFTTNQAVYDDADAVANMLKKVVVSKASTIRMKDNVCVSMGLDVKQNETIGYWTTNETLIGWIELTDEQLLFTDTGVELNLDGISDPCDIKLDIAVEDTGTFRSSLNASYNERTGKWEKDPNDGPVNVSITPEGGEEILDYAEASTAVAWSFPTYTITGEVVHGKGEIVLNGFIVNSVDVAEGTSPEVVYRGKGGYVIDYLEVDGVVQTDFSKDAYNWFFLNVGADHDIKVGFTSVFTTPYPDVSPVVQTYDGTAYGPEVSEPSFLDGYDYDWYPVYSTTIDGEYTTTGGVSNVVYDENGEPMAQTVYVKIMIMQPGYEDGVILDDWVGTSTVTILPRTITVKFDDYAQTTTTRKTSGFEYEVIDGIIVDGDSLDYNSGKCTSYPSKGSSTTGSITSDGTMNVTTPGLETSNYTVIVVNGNYYYPDHDLVASAPSILKVYDGISTNTTVTVIYPTYAKTGYSEGSWVSQGGQSRPGGRPSQQQSQSETMAITNTYLTITYSTDGGITYTSTNPSYVDVSTNTINYKVEYYEVTRTVTRTQTRSWFSTSYTYTTNSPTTTTWTPYYGTATITIVPRTVTIRALSDEKVYDGTPLTAGLTIDAPTSTTGFVEGEGFSSINPTKDSTITNPGSTLNVVDLENAQLNSDTKASNYTFKTVDGKLVVKPNPISATSTNVVKTYDGEPSSPIVVTPTFTNGTEFTSGTIYYRTSTSEEWSTTMPETPTDSGTYPIYYKVDGGGYGVVEGVATITINPRKVVLQALDATKKYDGTSLTTNGFIVVSGFVDGEGLESVTMTSESSIINPGSTSNSINLYDTEHWVVKEGTNIGNYTFEKIDGTLTVIGGVALMIVDHKAETSGYEDVCVYAQYNGYRTFQWWYNPTNWMAKVGGTTNEMEKSSPVKVEVVGTEMEENKVWIRVPIDESRTNNYIRAYVECTNGVAWTHSNGKDVLDYSDNNGVESINIHAMLKVNSDTTNTMVAIPWTWYSETEPEALPIPSSKLVRTIDLSTMDSLLKWIDTNSTYCAWYILDNKWTSMNGIKFGDTKIEDGKRKLGYIELWNDDQDLPITNQLNSVRGGGMWVIRNTSSPKDIWLCGQFNESPCETTILPAPTNKVGDTAIDVTSTQIGNPFGQSIHINSISFEGTIGTNDRIWIPNGTDTPFYLSYNKSRKVWWYSAIDPSSGRTTRIMDVQVEPGKSFWYDRREDTPLILKW